MPQMMNGYIFAKVLKDGHSEAKSFSLEKSEIRMARAADEEEAAKAAWERAAIRAEAGAGAGTGAGAVAGAVFVCLFACSFASLFV